MIDFEWQPIALMLVIVTVVAMLAGPRRRNRRPDGVGVEPDIFAADSQGQLKKLHGL